MAIELSFAFAKDIFRGPKENCAPFVALPRDPYVLSGHEKLFNHYGIPLDILEGVPQSRITMLPTKDGPICIYWRERTFVAPPNYYCSLANKITP